MACLDPGACRGLCLILREEDEHQEYRAAARSAGFCARYIRVLGFRRENEDVLQSIVSSGCAAYSGLLLSSPQGAASLLRACASGVAPAAVQALPAFSVGAKTALALLAAGIRAAAAPSAQELLPVIGAQRAALLAAGGGKPLLYLAGNKRLECLPAGLAALDIPFAELLVYTTEALPAADIAEQLAAALAPALAPPPDSVASVAAATAEDGGGRADAAARRVHRESAHRHIALVVFSPSGLEACASATAAPAAASGGAPGLGGALLRQCLPAADRHTGVAADAVRLPDELAVQIVAFGKTTASAVSARGLPVAATTTSPDAAGVGAALLSLQDAGIAGGTVAAAASV